MLDLFDVKEWLDREETIGQHLIKALGQRYQKTFFQPEKEIRKLTERAMLPLTAHNAFSRRWWYRSIGHHLAECLGAEAPEYIPAKPAYMLTLIDTKMMVNPDRDANKTDKTPTFSQIKDAYSKHLVGLDCLGMIDVAMYVSLQRSHSVDRLYGYHIHVLVWNTTRRKIAALCKSINMKFRGFISHTTAAHFQKIEPKDFRQVLWYCMKTPCRQYQVYQRQTLRWRQYDRSINGVNSVRLYAEMGHLRLEELTVANGEGHKVLRRASRNAARWADRKPKRR